MFLFWYITRPRRDHGQPTTDGRNGNGQVGTGGDGGFAGVLFGGTAGRFRPRNFLFFENRNRLIPGISPAVPAASSNAATKTDPEGGARQQSKFVWESKKLAS